jgi:predicted DCC family thiol-disulfide oxidoreductase YuxK
MRYYLIYDGNCNLCVNFTKGLETLDQGQIFRYIPMQAHDLLENLGVTPEDCQKGMILIDSVNPELRWQGSDAAEEITRLLPLGEPLISLYRSLPSLQWLGARLYDQVRDNRYQWFGQRETTYVSNYAPDCQCQ